MNIEDKVFMQAMSIENIIGNNGLLPVMKNRKDLKENEYFEEYIDLADTEFVMAYRVVIPNSRASIVVSNEVADLLRKDILPVLNNQSHKAKLQIWATMGFDLEEMFSHEDVSVREMIKNTTNLDFSIQNIALQNHSKTADYTIMQYGGEFTGNTVFVVANDVFDNAGLFALDISGMRNIGKATQCKHFLIGFADSNELIIVPCCKDTIFEDMAILENVLGQYDNPLSETVYTISTVPPILLSKANDLSQVNKRVSVMEITELETLIEEELGF